MSFSCDPYNTTDMSSSSKRANRFATNPHRKAASLARLTSCTRDPVELILSPNTILKGPSA